MLRKKVFVVAFISICIVLSFTICVNAEPKSSSIANGKEFHNGHAWMQLVDEGNQLFWGLVDTNFNFIIDAAKDCGYDIRLLSGK